MAEEDILFQLGLNVDSLDQLQPFKAEKDIQNLRPGAKEQPG